MTDLTTIPAIRAEAERLAREYHAARGPHGIGAFKWDVLSRLQTDADIGVQLRLLTDLSRPASRDAIARLVAAKLGWAVTATAPELTRVFPGWWALGSGREQMIFCEPSEYESDPPHLRGHKIGIAGITAVTDPATALAIIARRVLGGEE